MCKHTVLKISDMNLDLIFLGLSWFKEILQMKMKAG